MIVVVLCLTDCTKAQNNSSSSSSLDKNIIAENSEIKLGNELFSQYLPILKEKNVAVVGNHTSFVKNKHLVDTLLSLGVNVVKVFSPEHGFRGTADAGQKVANQIDERSGLPIISLYGKNKKPTVEQLKDVDIFLFDIQDVGVRFYTYISTLHYVMESAAENKKKVIVLDRPNPNDYFIDGPILEKKYSSFIGLHPIPVVHGMTIGEYAKMINGESWLKGGITCDLEVIECQNYFHGKEYALSIAPSPNLPNMEAVYLYPSLCFFEGTPISVGRGTNKPFQQIGHPKLKEYSHSFIPKPNLGAKYPKLKNEKCFGVDFTAKEVTDFKNGKQLNLSYLIHFYQSYPVKDRFFTDFFNLLAGNASLGKAITEGKSEEEIRKTWELGIAQYKKKREKYLLYD